MRKNLFLKVGLLVALMMTMYACDQDKPETPDPEKKPGIEVGTGQSNLRGVEVVVEAVDLRSGTSYSFTPRGKGGDVELEGAGFHAAKEGTNIVPIKLDFYAKKDIIFKGWSWRYAKDGVKPIEKAVALQTKDGMQALGVTRTIRADHTVDSKVYVRVEYEGLDSKTLIQLPSLPPHLAREEGNVGAKYYEVVLSPSYLRFSEQNTIVSRLGKYFDDVSTNSIPGSATTNYGLSGVEWGSIAEIIQHVTNLESATEYLLNDTKAVYNALSYGVEDPYMFEVDGYWALKDPNLQYITLQQANMWVDDFSNNMEDTKKALQEYKRTLTNFKGNVPAGRNAYYYIPF